MSETKDAVEPAGLKLLIDTNVWLDFYLGYRQGSKDAARFLSAARNAGAQLLYPASSLKDFFFLIVASLKQKAREDGDALDEGTIAAIRTIAWGCVDSLREISNAVGLDESDLWLACKYRKVTWDLEDNVVLAAAKRVDADCLVTSDRALAEKAPLMALAPADMATYLEELT